MEGYMGRSHESQTEFFQKLSDGSAKFLAQFLEPRPPSGPDFDRCSRLPATQTIAEWLTFLQSHEAARLGEFNLSLRPGDDAAISLLDLHADARGRRSASLVGLMAEDYDDLIRQRLPLGGLDTADLALRNVQADWIRLYADRLTRTSQLIYERNARGQIWTTWVAVLAAILSAAAPFPIFEFSPTPAALIVIGVAAPMGVGFFTWAICALNRNARRLWQKEFCDEMTAKSLAVAALTRSRQDNLIALIEALFAGAAHLYEDVAEIELTADTAKHIGLIFALHGLLCDNRQTTRWHMRILGMAHDSLSIRMLDQALMKRRRLGKLANFGLRRIIPALGGLGFAALPALVPVAGAVMHRLLPPGIGLTALSALVSVASASVTIGVAATGILRLHATTNRVVDEEELSEMCAEAAFATTPGPAEIRLEVRLSQLTGRTIVRLLRESHKQH
jgi:hypothetical protein